MEFLVHVEIDLPTSWAEGEASALRAAELARAAELRASGKLVRIWRIPGRQANWSLYSVADASELDAVISSLPLWPWMTVEVHALAVHPVEADS